MTETNKKEWQPTPINFWRPKLEDTATRLKRWVQPWQPKNTRPVLPEGEFYDDERPQ